jgi:hypothetical protein
MLQSVENVIVDLLVAVDPVGQRRPRPEGKKVGRGASLSPAASTRPKPRTWVLGVACQNRRLGPEPCQAAQSAQSRPSF